MTGLDSILKVHTQISVFMILIHQIDNIKYFQKLTCNECNIHRIFRLCSNNMEVNIYLKYIYVDSSYHLYHRCCCMMHDRKHKK